MVTGATAMIGNDYPKTGEYRRDGPGMSTALTAISTSPKMS
jgi:hypothetical protein